jgi:hypothetical protein
MFFFYFKNYFLADSYKFNSMHDLLVIQESIQNNVIHFGKEALVFAVSKNGLQPSPKPVLINQYDLIKKQQIFKRKHLN